LEGEQSFKQTTSIEAVSSAFIMRKIPFGNNSGTLSGGGLDIDLFDPFRAVFQPFNAQKIGDTHFLGKRRGRNGFCSALP
jgi:hypothetical protein